MLPYTGIGSRDVTNDEAAMAMAFADYMSKCGMTLYTGDALGADQAFHLGSNNTVVWTPYQRNSGMPGVHIDAGSSDIGRQWVRDVHPNPGAVLGKLKVEPYLVRDAHQIIGMPPIYPLTTFVVYVGTWVGGTSLVKGGTGQAVRIATKLGIPCFNLRGSTFGAALKFAEEVLRKNK